MGYRSEVSLTLRHEDFNVLLTKARAECTDAYALIKGNPVYRTEKYTTMYFDWIKWYESYPEVQFIESFKCEVPHVFRRLGEDDSDYEYTENSREDGEF